MQILERDKQRVSENENREYERVFYGTFPLLNLSYLLKAEERLRLGQEMVKVWNSSITSFWFLRCYSQSLMTMQTNNWLVHITSITTTRVNLANVQRAAWFFTHKPRLFDSN